MNPGGTLARRDRSTAPLRLEFPGARSPSLSGGGEGPSTPPTITTDFRDQDALTEITALDFPKHDQRVRDGPPIAREKWDQT